MDATGQLLSTLLPNSDPRLPRNHGDQPAGMTTARVTSRKTGGMSAGHYGPGRTDLHSRDRHPGCTGPPWPAWCPDGINARRRVAAAGPSVAASPIGGDYVAACKAMHWTVPEAADIEAGLGAVTQGAAGEFRQEYACTDPATAQDRWFQVRITRFGQGAGLRLVVAHEDITEVRRSADALKAIAGRLLTSQDKERRRIAR
jgi:hypothetical protein